jgi:hypothetical protein
VLPGPTGRTVDVMTGKAKIAIVGAGHVGVTLAYACLIGGAGNTIALYGRDAGKVRAEVSDLQRGLQFVPMATVEGSDDVEVCALPSHPAVRRLGALLPWCCGDQPLLRRLLAGLTRASG